MKNLPSRMKRIFSNHKNVILSIIFILSITNTFDYFLAVTPVKYFDHKGEEYIDSTLMRAAGSFATARVINSIISLLQDVTIDIAPMGVGVQIPIGELLDPINDMVERASYLFLLSTISLSIQKILMEIFQVVSIRYLLSISMVFFILHNLFASRIKFNFKNIALKLLAVSIIIRMFIPVVGFLNESLYHNFLDKKYEKSTGYMDKLKNDLDEVNAIASIQDDNKSKILAAMKKAKKKLVQLKNKVTQVVDNFVDLMTIFIIQTILLPLLSLWLLAKLIPYFLGAQIGAKITSQVDTFARTYSDKNAFMKKKASE